MDIGKPVYPAQPSLRNYLFIAAVLHAVLILGVTFKALTLSPSEQAPTLEVLIVPGENDPSKHRQTGAYLSTVSQQGGGTDDEKRRTSLPEASMYVEDSRGIEEGTAFSETAPDTSKQRTPISYIGSGKLRVKEEFRDPGDYRTDPMESRPVLSTGASALSEDLHLQGKRRASDQLKADTQASVMAQYLQEWKNRVEYIGTLNFPNSAKHRTLTGSPIIEVEIAADGTLLRVFLRKSSGFKELDRAALTIVRMASPFAPFPPEMKAVYPEIKFAYEWQFLAK